MAKPTVNETDKFAEIPLTLFISPGFGLAFDAPEVWEDSSNNDYFQVIDPQTNTQFTASAYKNPGVPLSEWANVRLSGAMTAMPFLREVKAPYPFEGVSWTGIVAEYRGYFPQCDYESHYLVLCLRTEKMVISFTITATIQAFTENEAFYRWLLQRKVRILEMVRMV